MLGFKSNGMTLEARLFFTHLFQLEWNRFETFRDHWVLSIPTIWSQKIFPPSTAPGHDLEVSWAERSSGESLPPNIPHGGGLPMVGVRTGFVPARLPNRVSQRKCFSSDLERGWTPSGAPLGAKKLLHPFEVNKASAKIALL